MTRRGTDVGNGEKGDRGVKNETEGNKWRFPGGDTLWMTQCHSMLLFREVPVSVHVHGRGTACVGSI